MKDLLRLLRLHRAQRGWMLAGLLLALLTLLANLGLLALSGWFIASMALAGLAGVSFNYFTPAALIRACAILRTGGRWSERVVSHEATFRVLSGLRVWLYRKIEPLAPAALRDLHGGDLLNRLTSDIDQLNDFYPRILLPLGVAITGSLMLLWFVAHYSHAATLALGAGLLLAGGLLPMAVLRATREDGRHLRALRARLRERLLDQGKALAELTLLGALPQQSRYIDALDAGLHTIERRHQRLRTAAELGVNLTAGLCFVAILLLALPAFSGLDGPAYAMLAMLTLAAFETVANLPLALQLLPETLASARRLSAIADRPPPVPEPTQPAPSPTGHEIVIDRVCLRYPGREKPALDDLSLRITEGERIAIVGASGAGKSSLLQLLLKLQAWDSGEIRLGGIPLDRLTGEQARACFASLSQHSHLFNASIRDNLLIARPDADSAALDEACERARILDTIRALPDGYDTWIGEAGARLSGGEQRRLALARALLKTAPILLLDEPTEGLDVETEQQVTAALAALETRRTQIIVTHKPALLRIVDRVALLDQGRLLALGKHIELLEKVPYYRDGLALPDLFS